MSKTRVFRANRKQMAFLQMLNDPQKKHICYGGARAGGKSWVLRLALCMLGQQYPGIRMCLVRRTLVDVRKNHVQPLKELLGDLARYNTTDRCFRFINGSQLDLEYYDSEKDVSHFQGNEWQVIAIDEATQMEETWIKNIATCCRGGDESYRRVVLYTCNPGGAGHTYIKRIFVDRKYKQDEVESEYGFVQARVTDNLYMMRTQPSYLNFLRSLAPKLRAQWLDGDWNVASGMYFSDFMVEPDVKAAIESGLDLDADELKAAHRYTHVIPAFKPKAHWTIYRSFDFGYHRPSAMGYYAVTDDGVIIRIAEYYFCQKSGGESIPNEGMKYAPDRLFAIIQKFEREHPYLAGREIQGIADPAIWDAEQGISIAETAMKYGIYFVKGDHKRVPGWLQCHYRLMFSDDGFPMFYCFDTCTEFIRTIPQLQYDEHDAEDLDTDGEDHIADEWRYMCMSRPIIPYIPEEEHLPAWGSDPLDQYGGESRW